MFIMVSDSMLCFMPQDGYCEQFCELQTAFDGKQPTLDLKSTFLVLGWKGVTLTTLNLKRVGRHRVSAKFQAVMKWLQLFLHSSGAPLRPGCSVIMTLSVVSYRDPHKKGPGGLASYLADPGSQPAIRIPCGVEATTLACLPWVTCDLWKQLQC